MQLRKLDSSLLNSSYKQIQSVITKGIIDAKKNNKKLMLLAGEDHHSEISLLLQIILLHIASEHGINNLLAEIPREIIKFIGTLDSPDEEKANLDYALPLAKTELKMKIIGADSIAYMHMSVEDRDKEMVNVSLKINSDAIFILGGAHLHGLMTDERLKSQFHLVGMNLTGFSCEELKIWSRQPELLATSKLAPLKIDFLSDPKNVVQVNFPKDKMPLLKPDEIVLIAQSLHHSQKDKIISSVSGPFVNIMMPGKTRISFFNGRKNIPIIHAYRPSQSSFPKHLAFEHRKFSALTNATHNYSYLKNNLFTNPRVGKKVLLAGGLLLGGISVIQNLKFR